MHFSNYAIGTSGFSYDDWIGTFYPTGISKNEMLLFYASHFKTVEINVTYYTIPSANSFEKMAGKVPAEFEFIVKVNRETTHRRLDNKRAIDQLLEALKPLKEQQKLAGLLAQFPYSFLNKEQNRSYLLQTKEYTKDEELFVEFRNNSWENEAVKNFLESGKIGYVNVDEPALKGLISTQSWLTTQKGYVRFHGRNKKDWWEGKGSERYNYNYSNDELQSWLIRISDILKKSYKSYVFFNNHPRGNAPKNATTLDEMLKQFIV